ncbi:Creatinase/aminopeptidase [Hortaea werneckii]|nr:Creatinase/aminopeptidase [Hortaea werneckii]
MPHAELVQHIDARFSRKSHACTKPGADVGLVEVGRFVCLNPDAVANAVRKVLAVTSIGDDAACGDIDARGCRTLSFSAWSGSEDAATESVEAAVFELTPADVGRVAEIVTLLPVTKPPCGNAPSSSKSTMSKNGAKPIADMVQGLSVHGQSTFPYSLHVATRLPVGFSPATPDDVVSDLLIHHKQHIAIFRKQSALPQGLIRVPMLFPADYLITLGESRYPKHSHSAHLKCWCQYAGPCDNLTRIGVVLGGVAGLHDERRDRRGMQRAREIVAAGNKLGCADGLGRVEEVEIRLQVADGTGLDVGEPFLIKYQHALVSASVSDRPGLLLSRSISQMNGALHVRHSLYSFMSIPAFTT